MPEFSGTTTVVFFAGGAGLLLLIHPERIIGAARIKLSARSFTVFHLATWLVIGEPLRAVRAASVRGVCGGEKCCFGACARRSRRRRAREKKATCQTGPTQLSLDQAASLPGSPGLLRVVMNSIIARPVSSIS